MSRHRKPIKGHVGNGEFCFDTRCSNGMHICHENAVCQPVDSFESGVY